MPASGQSSARCSAQGLTRLQSGSLGHLLTWRPSKGRVLCQAHSCWRISSCPGAQGCGPQLLAGCWLEVSRHSSRPPALPCHVDLSDLPAHLSEQGESPEECASPRDTVTGSARPSVSTFPCAWPSWSTSGSDEARTSAFWMPCALLLSCSSFLPYWGPYLSLLFSSFYF